MSGSVAASVPDLRVPNDLTELDQWVLWRHETRDSNPTKIPCQLTGDHASTTDPSTWATYEQVVAVWTAQPDKFAGIGFVFSPDDPFTGIDLDDCVQAGQPKPWAQKILTTLGDTYIEISPSGQGVKTWTKAKLPTSGAKAFVDVNGDVLQNVKNPKTDLRIDGGIEIYDRGRFFTVTGRAFNGAPLQIEDHQSDVSALYQTLKGSAVAGKPKADIADRAPVFEGGRHDYLTSVAAQFGAKGMNLEEIFAATNAINQSRCKPPKSEREVREICEWVVNRELTKGPVLSRSAPVTRASGAAPELMYFLQNDHGNSERIVATCGSDLRYCHPLKKWLVWDGRRWAVDSCEQSRRLAKTTMLEYLRQSMAVESNVDVKFAKSSLDSKRITNALKEAQDQIRVLPGDLDQHPYLLNFLNGTIDLRSSSLREHRREDFITKVVHHNYNPAAKCPRFRQFLDEVILAKNI